jgi:hypothetical protein
VGLRHREMTSHLHPPVKSVSRANSPSKSSCSHMTLSDTALSTAPSTVDEALAEIECQRELIVELMHLGQPTDAAELALNGMFREFASMIEYERSMLDEGLQLKRSA